MKRRSIFLLCLLIFGLGFLNVTAFADDAGVLTEAELGPWVAQVLAQTRGEEPQNAPIGEESLTEEGYAFMYSFATLYYDKPVLDENSVLQGFAVTDEQMETPRGLHLGSAAEEIIAVYGWQNPELYGDGSFAVLYMLNELPQGAYWSWVQIGEGGMLSAQCAVHAAVGQNGMYTDAGILYDLLDGHIAGIRVYGLKQTVTRAGVESNLRAVVAVQAAGSGDEEPGMPLLPSAGLAEVSFVKNEAASFGEEDLHLTQLDFLHLNDMEAAQVFGQPLDEEWVRDDTGEWLRSIRYSSAMLTYVLDENRENARLESASIVSPALEGPRGIRIGDALESVLAQFRNDGESEWHDGRALLYGDGQAAPYGEISLSEAGVALRYAVSIQTADGSAREVTLHLAFTDDRLNEILVYSW